jgi:Arc/MetJ-type ribon-helix-helix transcriptional regulator
LSTGCKTDNLNHELSVFYFGEFVIHLCNTKTKHNVMKSVRLNKDLEKQLKKRAYADNISESEVVREALVAYLSNTDNKESSYSVGKTLFGQTSSSQNTSNRSTTYKSRLKSKIREKTSR